MSNLLNVDCPAIQIGAMKSGDSCFSFFGRLHCDKSETPRFARMWVQHNGSLFNLFASLVSSCRGRTKQNWRTRPIFAKAASSSRLSTRELNPETWRLFPGLEPPSSARLAVHQHQSALKFDRKNIPSVSITPRAPAPTRPAWRGITSRRTGVPIVPLIILRCTIGHGNVSGGNADATRGDVLGLPC
jgi:hypothetical protein